MEVRGGPRPAPGTLNKLFLDAISSYNRPDALQVKSGGTYKPISHAEVAVRVRRAARGLQASTAAAARSTGVFAGRPTE